MRAALLAASDARRRTCGPPSGEAGLYDRIVRPAAVLNTPLVAARAAGDPRYRAEKNRTPPRKIGSHLVLFDCINCDKCVPVCPERRELRLRDAAR